MRKLVFLAFISKLAFAETPNPCYWAGPTFVQCFPTGGIYLPNQRVLRLGGDEASNTNYVDLQAAGNTTPSSYRIILPADQGTIGYVLVNTDGTGALGWTAPGASTADLNAVRAETASKQATDLVCHSNVALTGLQTCDGQSTTNAGRILAMAQTDVTENGVWSNDDFGAWTRPADFPSSSATHGSLVTVTEQGGGTSYQDTLWFGIGDGSSTSNFRLIPTTASNTQLTASRAMATDANSKLSVSATTATELGYVSGVSSAIQTQLNTKTTNPMTTTGDIIYASNTATPATAARLGVGGANTVLHGGASIPAYSAVVDADISGQVGVAHGGTGVATLASNGVLYGNGATSVLALAVNSTATNKFLTQVSSGAPAWNVIGATDVPVATTGANGGITLKAPTVQSFASGTSTYTTPAGVLWIKIRMVGGGGGGAGGGNGTETSGSDGVDTTWAVHSGAIFLTAGKGGGGVAAGGGGAGGTGGTATLGAPAIGIAIDGARGKGGPNSTVATVLLAGGGGGNSFFGGGGGGGGEATAGGVGVAKTGGGGAGGGTSTTATSNFGGDGGGAGAYIEAIIGSPSGSYDYAVGTGGAKGNAGSAGFDGGAGGAGYITVEEHYY